MPGDIASSAPVQAPGAAAKFAAVFLLGIGAGGGILYTIIHPAPAAVQAAPQQIPPIVVQLLPPPVSVPDTPTSPAAASPSDELHTSPPPAVGENGAEVMGPPAPPAELTNTSSPLRSTSPDIAPSASNSSRPAVKAPPPALTAPTPKSPTRDDLIKPDAAHKLNLNTASQAELELLPSVGPVMAKKIMEYREKNGGFKSTKELDKVRGIGPKTLEKLLPLVTVEVNKAAPR